MRWGIVDVTDETWIGSEKGPITFDEKDFDSPEITLGVARVSAQTLETQVFGTDLGCVFQVREFVPRSLRKKEDIPIKMDALAALRRIEGTNDGSE